jgi:hypothetical protein
VGTNLRYGTTRLDTTSTLDDMVGVRTPTSQKEEGILNHTKEEEQYKQDEKLVEDIKKELIKNPLHNSDTTILNEIKNRYSIEKYKLDFPKRTLYHLAKLTIKNIFENQIKSKNNGTMPKEGWKLDDYLTTEEVYKITTDQNIIFKVCRDNGASIKYHPGENTYQANGQKIRMDDLDKNVRESLVGYAHIHTSEEEPKYHQSQNNQRKIGRFRRFLEKTFS